MLYKEKALDVTENYSHMIITLGSHFSVKNVYPFNFLFFNSGYRNFRANGGCV